MSVITSDKVTILPKLSPTRNDGASKEEKRAVVPGRRVSFADTRGQNLERVHLFKPGDELINLSKITSQLLINENSKPPYIYELSNFTQPISNYHSFLENLNRNNITLENIHADKNHLIGSVHAKNIGTQKDVTVRMTYNDWKSFSDIPCSYAKHSSGSPKEYIHQFVFKVDLEEILFSFVSVRLEFALRYTCDVREYWDNNFRQNYRLTIIKEKLLNKSDI